MKIYTVLITCNYDGESLKLFTSLSHAVKFAQKEFIEAMDFAYDTHQNNGIMDDEDRKQISELYEKNWPSYPRVKNGIIQSCDEYNSWSAQIYTDYSWDCVISMYDTNNKSNDNSLSLW